MQLCVTALPSTSEIATAVYRHSVFRLYNILPHVLFWDFAGMGAVGPGNKSGTWDPRQDQHFIRRQVDLPFFKSQRLERQAFCCLEGSGGVILCLRSEKAGLQRSPTSVWPWATAHHRRTSFPPLKSKLKIIPANWKLSSEQRSCFKVPGTWRWQYVAAPISVPFKSTPELHFHLISPALIQGMGILTSPGL